MKRKLYSAEQAVFRKEINGCSICGGPIIGAVIVLHSEGDGIEVGYCELDTITILYILAGILMWT